LSGTLGSPNSLGGYLALVIPVALGLSIGGTTRVVRVFGATAFAVGGVLLILTASRGAWIGTAAGIGVFLAAAWRLQWMTPRQRVVALVVPVIVAGVFWGAVFDRLSSFDDDAALARLPLMRLAWSMIVDHPVLGVGSNNFVTSLGPYLTSDFSRDWISTVHNKYLLVWAETGILGLSTFLWMLGSTLKRALRLAGSSDIHLAPLALGLASGIVANMVHMVADIFNNRPHVQILWLMIALVLAADYRFNLERSGDRVADLPSPRPAGLHR
jgi:O-antigen ligase